MPHPRNSSEGDRMARAAAVDRLRKVHGLRVSSHRWNDEYVAGLIQSIEPGLSGTPALVIRAWLSVKPANVTEPRTLSRHTQPYQPRKCGQMAAAMERLKEFPRPAALVSNIAYSRWID